jgi:hypothetical protein
MRISRRLLLGASAVALIAGGGAAAAWANGGGGPAQPANPNAGPAASPAAIDSSTESKYTPIPQCRVVDTRLSVGGQVAVNSVRSWHVSGTTGFVPQGGTNGGCGVPASATAVTAVIQSISATGVGDLHLWPVGSTEPQRNFLNFTNVYNVSDSATFQINPAGGNDIAVRAQVHATHIVIDVTGYYVKPLSAFLNSNASILHGSRTTNAIHLGTGEYEVDFDRDVSACTYNATPYITPYVLDVEPRSGNVNGVFIAIQTPTGTFSDVPFYLTVTC